MLKYFSERDELFSDLGQQYSELGCIIQLIKRLVLIKSDNFLCHESSLSLCSSHSQLNQDVLEIFLSQIRQQGEIYDYP